MFDGTRSQSVAEPDHPDVAYAIKEAKDLALALALCYAKERLERFHAEYRVLAIEPEIRVVLYENDYYQVVLMSRPDGIIERLSDGALLQWEIKSKQNINKNYTDSWEHNLQLVAQQMAIKQWANDNGFADRQIVGALIEVLIKGKRDRNDTTGLWTQQSPLIYAYIKRGDGLLIQDQISHSWKKGWPKQLVSEVMPLEQWIFNELSSEVTATKCVTILPAAPSEWDIANASEQWGLAAIADYDRARSVNSATEVIYPHVLNGYFAQNTDCCYRYGKCQFYDLCWSSLGEDPLSGPFQMRQPNHPETLEE